MAETKKPSHAQKAAGAKRKAGAEKKDKSTPKPEKNGGEPKFRLPIRFITSCSFLLAFIVSTIMLLRPDGVVVQMLYRLILGLIGRAAFYFSVPAWLYLFCIHAFSGDRPVKMRTACIASFVLIAGCISHLILSSSNMLPTSMEFFSTMYDGGIHGTTGGVICGFVGSLMRWLIYDWLSLIFLGIGAVFTLLGAMQITIPSIIRAIEERPKATWETEDKPPRPEPAAVVVNHIATKRIEMIENRRKNQAEKKNIDIPLDGETRPKKKKPISRKAQQMISQIDEIDTPVGAAENYVEDVDDTVYNASTGKEQKKPAKKPKEEPAEVPAPVAESGMPPLIYDFEDEAPAPVASQAEPAKVTAKEAAASAAEVAAEIAENEAGEKPIYCFPPLDLLVAAKGTHTNGAAEMEENTQRLNEALASFKIEAHIINVTRGPSVTRYEVELEKGVRLNKLTAVADDIALSLGATGVRIAAVPGKISVVGIEVPNRSVTTVSLRDVIGSGEFNRAKSKSSFAVGKDIGGSCIVGNIAKLPHMLIAGTTGSGKSVCMNSIIISLLYKASPDDVKLIMIDPKMVELGVYNGIPHLLIPVVTDPKKAAGSLQWAVTEMMRRYKAMSDAGVRDLESYNSIIEAEEEGSKLPQVVVIIDELADLMLVAAKEVEESICRIAQMGRASGIHLVIATQRPSADVITGLMKANIPSRIAFSVASAMESRIILDTPGAEKLVGRGDMLFSPIGCGKPLRVQGCFVSDSEVEAVATYVKDNFISAYDQTVMEEIERKALQTGTGKGTAPAETEANAEELDGDEMLPAAVDVILETGQASVSMLQRRLKLGYARAARIVDEMEEKGIVGPFQGSKPRSILVTKEQWEAMKGGAPAASDELPFDEEDPDDF